MNIEIKGLNQVRVKVEQLPKNVEKLGKLVVKEVATRTEEMAKREAPVHKGKLLGSITTEQTGRGLSARVSPKMKYARNLIEGTGIWKGTPDLGRARWNRIRREYTRIRPKKGGNSYYKRTTPPLKPMGIRPDKFMGRGYLQILPKAQDIANKFIKDFINKF